MRKVWLLRVLYYLWVHLGRPGRGWMRVVRGVNAALGGTI